LGINFEAFILAKRPLADDVLPNPRIYCLTSLLKSIIKINLIDMSAVKITVLFCILSVTLALPVSISLSNTNEKMLQGKNTGLNDMFF
jgi:hypothetical protein